MNKNYYQLLIEKIIKSCERKNAATFASCFSKDGEIQLNSEIKITKDNIETVTSNYFTDLKYIKIDILGIAINEENNLAFIEWIWSDYNLKKQRENSHQNVIALQFQNNLIYRWREYKLS